MCVRKTKREEDVGGGGGGRGKETEADGAKEGGRERKEILTQQQVVTLISNQFWP